ncbi:MAG: response regulator [Planctomycetes bacterium]|nr:response regulator [Planctomycetota bacterium]
MGHNILIVDDSATMRKIIMRSLRQSGIEAAFSEAGDGVEGLAALEGGKFDLILSDVNMPNMNGLEFVKQVSEKHADAPPIVMITTESSDAVQSALENGAKGYLKKPFKPENVQEVVTPLLG